MNGLVRQPASQSVTNKDSHTSNTENYTSTFTFSVSVMVLFYFYPLFDILILLVVSSLVKRYEVNSSELVPNQMEVRKKQENACFFAHIHDILNHKLQTTEIRNCN